MPARDDYILRFINLLREAISEALRLRTAGNYEQALLTLLIAQEKLFARPAPQFVGLSLDEQLRLLSIGESPDNAATKVFGYGQLLREAGFIYEQRGRPDLAESAYQLALHVMLSAIVDARGPSRETMLGEARELLARVPPDQLHEPVKELLQRVALQQGPA